MQRKIHFFNESNSDSISFLKKDFRQIAQKIFIDYNIKVNYINVIFCDDEYLLIINQSYLDHDTYTDIITFDDGAEKKGSDMFISLDRIRENALKENLKPELELKRVFIHGCLHLCGLKDKTLVQKKKMRTLEEHYLYQKFEI